jgi:hypothetical protein
VTRRRKNPKPVAIAITASGRRHDVSRANHADAARPAKRISRWSCTSVSSTDCGDGRADAGTTLGTMMKYA